MLLVNNNHANLRKRSKQRRSWTDHHINLSILRPHELVIPFAAREPGMHHRYPVPEPLIEPPDRLKSQSDLRNQKDRLFSFPDHPRDQFHVYFGLAASRHAVKQTGLPDSALMICPYPLHRLCLFPVQENLFLFLCKMVSKRISVEGSAFHPDDPLILKAFDHCSRQLQAFHCFLIVQLLILKKCF